MAARGEQLQPEFEGGLEASDGRWTREASDRKWREAMTGGGEQSQVEGAKFRQWQLEASDYRWKEAMAGTAR